MKRSGIAGRNAVCGRKNSLPAVLTAPTAPAIPSSAQHFCQKSAVNVIAGGWRIILNSR
ncbi:hypothetical protein [Paenibacillus sp. HW567]|uniref:hypothetical protein n=1 Tax=Paenibacillus sp. HW567 TaxID=1034769 RepID=UPI0012EC10D6|nr:hypothetical protein [Paenibacillus sp. HW567]